MLCYQDVTGWLFTGDGVHRPVDALLARSSELDPLAFPISLSEYPLLRARQRECGVDLDCVERVFEGQLELLDAIAAVRAALGSEGTGFVRGTTWEACECRRRPGSPRRSGSRW